MDALNQALERASLILAGTLDPDSWIYRLVSRLHVGCSIEIRLTPNHGFVVWRVARRHDGEIIFQTREPVAIQVTSERALARAQQQLPGAWSDV